MPEELSSPLQPPIPPHTPGILNQTLGDLLRNNPQAQGMVMKAMNISQEQLQQLLSTTGNNQYMNMTIGELFKSGFVQKAVTASKTGDMGQMAPMQGQAPLHQGFEGQAVQMTPEQMQQILSTVNMQNPEQQTISIQIQTQPGQTPPQAGQPVGSDEKVAYTIPSGQPKQGFFQKIKGLFK